MTAVPCTEIHWANCMYAAASYSMITNCEWKAALKAPKATAIAISDQSTQRGVGFARPSPRRAPGGRAGHRGDAPPDVRDDQRGKRQPEHDHRDGLEVADQQQREACQQERQQDQRGQQGQPPEQQPRGVPGFVINRIDARPYGVKLGGHLAGSQL